MIHEAIIRQRDTMRVPPEVVEHLLRAGKGRLAYTTHGVARRCVMKAAKHGASASDAVLAAKVSVPS